MPFINVSDCRPVNLILGNCGDSPFGCGADVNINLGATYSIILQYAPAFDPYLVLLAIRPDLTADLFARFPAVYSGGVCSRCPGGNGDLWAAYGVAVAYDVNCQVTVPATAMARVVACGNQGSPSLQISIV